MANRTAAPEADENASLRARVTQLEQRLADYEQFAGRIGEIAQAVTAATGGAFFHALVEGLAKSLALEHAMVGELSRSSENRIHVLAMYSQGKHVENFEYALRGTPCENVMAGDLCVYPRGIQRLFPEDRQLAEMGAESYVGTPLLDSSGQSIGLIVVIDGNPLTDAARAEATLRIFAARATAELERLRAENARRESEHRFKAFMDNNPAVAFIKDSSGRFVYVNKPFCERFDTELDEIIGATDYEYFPADVASTMRERDAEILASGQAMQMIEEVPTPDGVLRHWLVYKFPVEDASGRKLLGGVAIDISRQKQAEGALRKARDELEQRVAMRTASLVEANNHLQREIQEREAAEAALRGEQHLLRQLLDSQEADRKLIAYEVHDGLLQYVAGALMHLETVAVADQRKPGDLGDSFMLAQRLLRDTIHEARRLISGLRPLILDESGIVQAIEYLVGECHGKPAVDFEHEMTFDRLPPIIEGALFRICQQALNNATRHSQSDSIRIRLVQQGAWVRLVVSDQGIGFDPAKVTEKMFGLQGIRERARLLGGHATIETAAGRGTRVAVEIPLSPSG
jgi:PAS domain S-box-containing protein